VSAQGEATGDRAATAASSAASPPSSPPDAPPARPPAKPSATLEGGRRWWSLVALCLSAAIVWFAAANIPVASAAISEDLGGSVTALQWVNTIFTLVCGALVIAAGRLGDIFGRRRVLGIGLVIFAAASVLAALAPTTGMLIAGRALMGAGAAAILSATLAIIPIGARLELRRGPRFPLATGTLIMGAGTFLAGLLAVDTPYWWFAMAIFIQGVGIGLFSTPLSDVAVGLAPPDQSGAASGAFKMCSMVGGALGVALLGGIYRALQLGQLRSDADAAHLTAEQQELVNDAFASSEKARQIYETLAPDVRDKVHDAVLAALSYGIGGSLKIVAVFSLSAVIAVLLLVPRGILHPDRQS
jgi:MFS family permease